MPQAAARRTWVKALSRRAPPHLRRLLADYRVQRVFRAQVAGAMRSACAVVIGGGQLVTGSSAFFAKRIAVIAEEARAAGIAVHVQSVGVSNPENWCPEAAALLSGALGGRNCRSVSLRDAASAEHWARAFGGPPPEIARDPALIARAAFFGLDATVSAAPGRGAAYDPASAAKQMTGTTQDGVAARRIGVGVISPAVVGFFGDSGSVPGGADMFADIVSNVVERGDRPILFSNGSAEDDLFLSDVCQALAGRDMHWRDHVDVADRPRTPEQLVRLIASMDAVLAHRLHANIVAYALRIPNVALAWDAKLLAFQRSVGRERWLLSSSDNVAATAGKLVEEAVAEGVEPVRHAHHVAETWDAIAGLVRRVAPLAGSGAPSAAGAGGRDRLVGSVAAV